MFKQVCTSRMKEMFKLPIIVNRNQIFNYRLKLRILFQHKCNSRMIMILKICIFKNAYDIQFPLLIVIARRHLHSSITHYFWNKFSEKKDIKFQTFKSGRRNRVYKLSTGMYVNFKDWKYYFLLKKNRKFINEERVIQTLERSTKENFQVLHTVCTSILKQASESLKTHTTSKNNTNSHMKNIYFVRNRLHRAYAKHPDKQPRFMVDQFLTNKVKKSNKMTGFILRTLPNYKIFTLISYSFSTIPSSIHCLLTHII